MSTSPEISARADDRMIAALSRWLARHISDEELWREVRQIGTDKLGPGQAEAVEELLAELEGSPRRADLEMVARETLEALALGA
jgi:hypothetical protein